MEFVEARRMKFVQRTELNLNASLIAEDICKVTLGLSVRVCFFITVLSLFS